MADMIVSPVIEVVLQRVVAYLEDRINLHSGVEEKVKKLEVVLNRIKPVANTAEEVDLEKHKDLKPWMRDLKVAVEEAKDVLDEFEYLRLKRQAEGDEARSSPSASPSSGKRVKSIVSCISLPFAKKINPSTDLLKRLKGIQSNLEELDSRSVPFLQLVADRKATDREHHNQYVQKRETSSSMVERELVGRRKELLEEITSKLMEEEEEEEKHISIIAVVGHGGMGKTTLAQHIFNDTRVESHFEMRMWVHVSQVFDVLRLTKKIIESATRTERCADTDSSLETLQQKLKEVLKSKRLLLVLDDVWYSHLMEEEWNKLCSPLVEACGEGSKILLTSRTPEVKELPAGALKSMILLQGLTQDECWSIIRTSAFRGSGIPDAYRDLEEIGKQIALKVQGSPLTSKAVGGILRKELHRRHWLTILKTDFLQLPGSGIMPVLMLSYQYLSPHLRQCFAYCSLFPKGHIFDVNMLVRMWVAHGYIGVRPLGEMTDEDLGKSYFDDLLSAGFFTCYFDNVWKESYVVMHDLMNDLARFVSREEIHRIDEQTQDCPIPKTVRHLSVRTDYLAVLNNNENICNLSNLESFLLIPYYRSVFGDDIDFDDNLVKKVLQQLQRVRVLDLNYCNVCDLPDDISHCLHLRYLDMSRTYIKRLPESLMVLYHLQVLNMADFSEALPLDIHSLEKLNNLVNLHFLSTGACLSLKLTCLRGLKSLQEVVGILSVEEGRGSEIRNLHDLNDLRGVVNLNNLHYIESGDAAREAELRGKNWLQGLRLKWRGDCSPDVAEEVLQGLEPPKYLELLNIDSYPGRVYPSWISSPFSEKVTSITLNNLFHLECLPPLGQLPCLQHLELKRLPKLKKLSQEGFPSLKILKIYQMEEVEEWSGPDGSGGLPCLTYLSISECPKMRMLPTLSLTVTELNISSCQALTPSALEEVLHAPLPSLKVLKINRCPGLLVQTSLSSATDAGEGMAIGPCPLALERLLIDDPLMLVTVPVLKSFTSVLQVGISNDFRIISVSPLLEEWLL